MADGVESKSPVWGSSSNLQRNNNDLPEIQLVETRPDVVDDVESESTATSTAAQISHAPAQDRSVPKKGDNILHSAVRNDNANEVREILRDPKFDVNAENSQGETALEIAVTEKYRDIERLLMDNPQVSAFVDRLYRDRQAYVDAANAILVGAALIASITYSGSLLLPSPPDPVNTTAVKAFWAFNSLSFFSAIATVLAGAYGAMPIFHHVFIGQVVKDVKKKLVLATSLLMFSVLCVLGAFTSGAFARLPDNVEKEYKILTTAPFGLFVCIIMILVISGQLICGRSTFRYLILPIQLLWQSLCCCISK